MFGLSADDLKIRTAASAFVESLIPYEVQVELDGGRIAPEAARDHKRRAIEAGLYATNIPASVGGRGMTALQQVLVQEQGGRITNGLSWVMAQPPQWFVDVATEYQMETWLKPAVAGDRHEAYAITEEFAGSDTSDLQTTARRDGDHYVISGVKWHVTSYEHADFVFVEAVLTDGEHAGNHVLLIVDVPSAGVEVVRTPKYTHNLVHEHPVVSFTDVRVPLANLVGTEAGPMTYSQDWFRFERLMVAARCVGAMQRLIDDTTSFAKNREIGGKKLIELQLAGGMLADSATELFAARGMLYAVARSIDAGADRKIVHGQASMAKLFCSEAAGRVADRCVQLFGGRGYMRENVAERLFREMRVERIWEGASDIQRVIIARQMMLRGPEALLEP